MTTRFRSPLRCEEAREHFDDFLEDRLGVEQRGRVRGHLLGCEECSSVLAERIDRAIAEGRLPEIQIVPPLAPPEPRVAAFKCGAVSGWLWKAPGTEDLWAPTVAARGAAAPEARKASWKARESLESLLRSAYGRWSESSYTAAPSREGALEAGGAWVEHLDEAWQPTGATSPALIEKGPAIKTNGEFHLDVLSDDARLEGRRLVCTVYLHKNEALVFATDVRRAPDGRRWLASFRAEGVPPHDDDVSIPLTEVNLYVSSGPDSE